MAIIENVVLLRKHMVHFSSMESIFAFRYYGFNLWQPELFNRFENYHQSHPNASVAVCELIRETQYTVTNYTVLEEPFVLLANEITTECEPHIDERVFINSLTINAVCLLGNAASGYLADRVGPRTMPGECYYINSSAYFILNFN